MADNGVSQSEIARRLGIRQPSVCAWLARRTRPDAERRELIEKLCAIPRGAWLTRREASARAEVAAKLAPEARAA